MKTRKPRTLRFEYWQATDKQWYWHLKSGREIIAQGEGYMRVSSCLRICQILRSEATITEFKLPIAPKRRAIDKRVIQIINKAAGKTILV